MLLACGQLPVQVLAFNRAGRFRVFGSSEVLGFHRLASGSQLVVSCLPQLPINWPNTQSAASSGSTWPPCVLEQAPRRERKTSKDRSLPGLELPVALDEHAGGHQNSQVGLGHLNLLVLGAFQTPQVPTANHSQTQVNQETDGTGPNFLVLAGPSPLPRDLFALP